jgi:hypothetical protein
MLRLNAETTNVSDSATSSQVNRRLEPLCSPPCTASLRPGAHRFALALPNGKAIIADSILDIRHPGTVRGEYVDNSGIRVVGGTMFVAGLVLAGGSGLVGLAFGEDADQDAVLAGVVTLALTAVVNMGVGFGLATGIQDGAIFRFD